MKFPFARPALLLALALGLAACGGKAMFDVGGSVFSLAYPGLVVNNNGSDLSVAANATTFKFPSQVAYGDSFDVSVTKSPLHQTCVVVGADTTGHYKDTAGRMAAINVGVNCTMNSFLIGGTINGLTAAGLVLINGSTGGSVSPLATDTAFTFTGYPVTYGVTYGVSVLTNPTGQKCTVANSTAVMGDADVTNIVVNCIPEGLGG